MDHDQEAIAITWNYGTHTTIDFDPEHQLLDFGWITGEYFTVSEHDGAVIISLPGNQQSYMLEGVSLSDLSLDNIRANDPSTLDVWAAALEAAAEPAPEPDIATIAWNYGVDATIDFDPARQVLDFGWITGEYFTVGEHDGEVMISLPGNHQSFMLSGVSLSDLTLDNIRANDPSTLDVWAAALSEPEMSGHEPEVVTIAWNYGVDAMIDFDPAHQVLDFGWITGEYFTVGEHDGEVMISLPGNHQSFMLSGVSLSDLTLDNIRANDPSTLDVWAAALDAGEESGHEPEVVTIAWNYGVDAMIDFDPAHQVLDFGWITGEYFTVGEHDGEVMISLPGNHQSFMLSGVSLDDLTLDNIRANDQSTLDVWAAALDAGEEPEDPDHHHGSEHIFEIAWNYGTHTEIDFDPTHQLLDFGWITGQYFTVAEVDGSVVISLPSALQTITLPGVTLSEMSIANIMANDPSTLAVWSDVLDDPVDRPEDPDLPEGGTIFAMSTSGPDIVGFDPAVDKLDLGENSVHAFVVVDTPDGVGFLNPWNGTVQIVQGVGLADLDVGNFAPVVNNHLREDLSGALAWEHGIVEQPHTVYARSHEYGQVDRVAFDPVTDIVDFRYYGSRENLAMIQSDEGVVIANGGTGQKLILLGTTLDQLSGANFVFHYAQVYEDHLDQQLGIAFLPENVLDRDGIPTAGAGTAMGMGTGHGDAELGTVTTIAWNWGVDAVVAFDPQRDILDFGSFLPGDFTVREEDDSVVIDLTGHHQTYALENVGLDDLSIGNIMAHDAGTLSAWAGYLA